MSASTTRPSPLQALRSRDPLDLIPRLTLLLVIPVDRPGLIVPAGLAMAVVMLARPVYRNPWFWFAVGVALTLDQAARWYEIDNHAWLIVYWVFAVGFSMLADDPRAVLRRDARLIIGLLFLFATAWKLISSMFVNGAMFHYLFLTDDRFEPIARVVGGVSSEALAGNLEAMNELRAAAEPAGTVLVTTGRLGAAAVVLTVVTLVVEAALAVTFLAPDRFRLAAARNIVLGLFAVGTYALVPVTKFAAVLLIMGLSQATDNRRHQNAYLIGLVLLIVYSPIWHAVVDPTIR